MKETAASPPLPPFLCGPAAVLLASLLSQVKVGKARRPPPAAVRLSLLASLDVLIRAKVGEVKNELHLDYF